MKLLKYTLLVSIVVASASGALQESAPVIVQGSSFDLKLPMPIGASDVTRWKRMLHLSEEQSAEVVRLVDECVRSQGELTSKDLPSLKVMAREAARSKSGTVQQSEHIDAVMKARTRYVAKLSALEAQLFEQIGEFLTVDQIIALEDVRADRWRGASSLDFAELPKARVDLITLLETVSKLSLPLGEGWGEGVWFRYSRTISLFCTALTLPSPRGRGF